MTLIFISKNELNWTALLQIHTVLFKRKNGGNDDVAELTM